MLRSRPGRVLTSPILTALVLAGTLALGGCAGLKPEPVKDYDQLPGRDRMMKGPGVFTQDKEDYRGGTVVYSTDAPASEQTPPPAKGAAEPAKAAPATAQTSPAPQTGTDTSGQACTDAQFRAYQAFKRLDKNSAEYQMFQKWLEFQRYREWEKSRQGQ